MMQPGHRLLGFADAPVAGGARAARSIVTAPGRDRDDDHYAGHVMFPVWNKRTRSTTSHGRFLTGDLLLW